MKTALLVIDIQKDYFPEGKFPLVEPLAAAQKAYMLLQCFREHGGRHVHIQHISLKPDATFFIKGDSGSDIHDAVTHFEGEPIVYKHYPNSFRETNLLEILREWGVERVVISGMMTHMCVDATARAAFVTATHSHAFVAPSFQPVSSTFASAPFVASWAAAWVGSNARLTAASNLLTDPSDTGMSHTSANKVRTARLPSRPTPVRYAATAVNLGPNPLAASGTGAAVVASGSIGIRACAGGGGPRAATSPAGPAPGRRRGSGRRR